MAFGLGDALYFALKSEPSAAILAMGLVALCVSVAVAVYFRHRRAVFTLTILISLGLAGFAAGALRTALVQTPIVAENLGRVQVRGVVVDIRSASAERRRLLIAPVSVTGLSAAEIPARLRLVSQNATLPEPGDVIETSAILNPPPWPAAPGAFDFARDSYFERIGAVGATVAPIAAWDLNAAPDFKLSLSDQLEIGLNLWRWRLAQNLGADLAQWGGAGAPGVGLAVTMATSHQDFLSEADEDALRASGLAHLMAIAGLHMAAVSGITFFAFRALFARIPALALRVSPKRLAALAGLAVVAIYLALSGAHPPARRAAITAASAFIAMLLGRRAVSLHALANAALVILLLEPECVVQPGFQMSFSATGALVAWAEWLGARREVGLGQQGPWLFRVVQSLKDRLFGLIGVAAIAGFATAPFSLYHFNRVSLLSTPANLAADFVATLILMPSVALAGLGETLNLNPVILAPVLMVAEKASDLVLAIAHFFADAPMAQVSAASGSPVALALSFAGCVVAILWRGRLRFVGLALMLAVFVWPRAPDPIAWLGPGGENAATVINHQVWPMRPEHQSFSLDSFAQHRGLEVKVTENPYACDRQFCLAPETFHPRIGAWFTRRKPKPETLAALCQTDILILRADVDLGEACLKPLVLRRDDFRKFGAAEVLADGASWRLDWVATARGDRPWAIPPRDAREEGD